MSSQRLVHARREAIHAAFDGLQATLREHRYLKKWTAHLEIEDLPGDENLVTLELLHPLGSRRLWRELFVYPFAATMLLCSLVRSAQLYRLLEIVWLSVLARFFWLSVTSLRPNDLESGFWVAMTTHGHLPSIELFEWDNLPATVSRAGAVACLFCLAVGLLSGPSAWRSPFVSAAFLSGAAYLWISGRRGGIPSTVAFHSSTLKMMLFLGILVALPGFLVVLSSLRGHGAGMGALVAGRSPFEPIDATLDDTMWALTIGSVALVTMILLWGVPIVARELGSSDVGRSNLSYVSQRIRALGYRPPTWAVQKVQALLLLVINTILVWSVLGLGAVSLVSWAGHTLVPFLVPRLLVRLDLPSAVVLSVSCAALACGLGKQLARAFALALVPIRLRMRKNGYSLTQDRNALLHEVCGCAVIVSSRSHLVASSCSIVRS